MSNVIIDDTNLVNIANAIREKSGSTNTFLPSEMAAAIGAIDGGGSSEDVVTHKTGTFVATSDMQNKTIIHGLGKMPSIVIFFLIDTPLQTSTTYNQTIYSYVKINKNGTYTYCRVYVKRNSTSSTAATNYFMAETTYDTAQTGVAYITNVTETSFTAPRYVIQDKKYRWIAIG